MCEAPYARAASTCSWFQSLRGFSLYCDVLTRSTSGNADVFQSLNGFSLYCDATPRVRSVRTPAGFNPFSGFSVLRLGCVRFYVGVCVSIPSWVFCALQPDALLRHVGNVLMVSIPSWVFSVLRPNRPPDNVVADREFQSLSGFALFCDGC